MDNASIHHVAGIEELCSQYEVQLQFLPLYSPDLNLIELSFHTLKAWVRRYRQQMAEFASFEEFIREGVSVIGAQSARGYFMKAGYNCGQMG
jgi:transposase